MTPDEGTPEELSVLHYFVDEAGDPILFDRRGRVRAGTPGCSQYFMLGNLDVEDPEELRLRLDTLRAELLRDPYFKGVPSMQPENRKTAVAFHAKDDNPEVRREVFRLLSQCELRFYAVVRDKRALVKSVKQRNRSDPAYRYNQNEQYDNLVSELFRKFRYSADEVRICFAKRGASDRTNALSKALKNAENEFRNSYGFSMRWKVFVESSTPEWNTCLQAVDYFLWALQRYYERGEERFVELIWPQVFEVHELDRLEHGRRGVIFGKSRPLIAPSGDQT